MVFQTLKRRPSWQCAPDHSATVARMSISTCPGKAWPGRDPGWVPVFRPGHAPMQNPPRDCLAAPAPLPQRHPARTSAMSETIIVETRGKVGIIRLNRPQALNALNAKVNEELTAAIDAFEADANISCVILTG